MTICLTMIVRNESGVITRLLDSVHSIIDYWVVCDTGSSDDTPARVQSYFETRGIPGELHRHVWRDFGHNRTRALKLADGRADYMLLLDADMVLHRSPEFDPAALTADGYTLRQDAGDLSYYNLRLIRSELGWTCVGPTHEYYASPWARNDARLDTLWVEDRGDGGCRADKFRRDIAFLERAAAGEPNNARYQFYLAESYRNAGLLAEALCAYQRRIDLRGWAEEAWYAMYMKGVTLAALGRTGEAKAAFMDAHWHRSWRAEPLWALATLLRESGEYKTAVSLAEEGRSIRYPENDVLFVDRTAHDWRFDHELTICAYHAGCIETGRQACERLLARGDLPEYIRVNVLQNLVSYAPRLSALIGEPVAQQVIETDDACWRYTNPSVCRRGDGGYWLNLRQVNYRVRWPEYYLRGSGHPIDDDHPVTTENVLVPVDDELELAGSGYRLDIGAEDLPSYSCHARGYEDGRLFHFQGSLWLSVQTMQHSSDGLCRIHQVKIDDAGGGRAVRMLSPGDGARHEKNWMPFLHHGVLHYVYLCDPLTILQADPETGRCRQVSARPSPVCCRDFRGGSQGIPFDEGYLFVVHQVAERDGWRSYLHRFLAIGPGLGIVAISDAFCLNSPTIEFVAGLASDASGETVVLSWGCNDERALLARISARAVRQVLRPVAQQPATTQA